MSLRIRQASLQDVSSIAPLFDAYRIFYAQPSDLARARTFLGERLQQGESRIFFAESDGACIGFAQLYPMFSSVRTERVWVLNDLFVHPSARRNGAARALLDATIQFARADGAVRIVLETTRDNASARALYASAGWHQDATQWYSFELAET